MQSAFWELLLHELYRAAGFSLEVHPALEGTEHRPDFLVSRNGSSFLLEAHVVTATTAERRRRDRRLRTLIETINKAKPRDFYVRMEIVVEGPDQPAAGPVIAQLEPWLAGLDPDAVANSLLGAESFDALPSREIATGGWVLRFSPLPVDADKRGQLTGPLIGIEPAQTSVSDPTAAIRKALSKKDRHYGSTGLPLVVALAVEELGIETDDVAASLFGKVVTRVSVEGEPVVVGHSRLDDGYWSVRRNAGRRVAAAVTVATPRPWNIPTLVPRLWLNPWAPSGYTGARLWEWTTVDAVEPTLGEFFEIWGVPFSAERLGPYEAEGDEGVRVWVDGEPSGEFADLVLEDGQRVVVAYGTDAQMPPDVDR